jgi:hypothetical protein
MLELGDKLYYLSISSFTNEAVIEEVEVYSIISN